MNFSKILDLFKRKGEKKPSRRERRLIGSKNSRFAQWVDATLSKINLDIEEDLVDVVTKCRDLAKNSPIIRAYLSACVKNIVGKTGFTLQCQVKTADGTLDQKLNDDIEWEWYEFGKAMNGWLTVDGGMGHNDLDALIVKTLLTDGEVFIRIHHPESNFYNLSFEVVDSLAVDFTKRRDFGQSQSAIVLGVEVDRFYKPICYYLKQGTSIIYLAGPEERVPAADIIHIYRHDFPYQTRGIPPFNACLDALKNLEDYRIAEILAAKAGSCVGMVYERNNMPVKGDMIDEDEMDENGKFEQQIQPFMASVAPTGYSVKTMTPTHPNSGYGEFTKSILKQLASSLGMSYAKLLKDYEATNYSALREGTLDEADFYAEQQAFLIESWKEIEFKLFIEALALREDSPIKMSQAKDLLRHHTWVCQKRPWFDPAKDILATERELKLGLKSPLMIMEEGGIDPDELMKSWSQYKDMCEKYDLYFSTGEGKEDEEDEDKLAFEDQDFNDDNTQQEALDKER